VQAIGQPLGVAHKPGATWIFADADHNPFACRPWTLNSVGLHLGEQLLIDPLGSATQGKLTQGRQIGRREEMLQSAFSLLGNVDFTFLEPLDQIIGREID
jgi:hypothetical protein